MGLLTFSGQTLRFVGESALSVGSTPLSSSSTIRYIYSAENATSPAFIRYQPGLPDFLQGFTSFQPGSSYQMFVPAVSVLPVSAVSFIPPVGVFASEAAKMTSGLSFFVYCCCS
jgi:hypothetical protein